MKSWSTSGGYKILQILSGRSNVFLFTNGITNILIDSSPGFLWKSLQKRLNKLQIRQIQVLILTHSHFDHAGNAAVIKKKYNSQVIIHRSEAGYLQSGDNILPCGTNAFSRFIVRAFAKQLRSFAYYQSCHPDHLADDLYDLSYLGFNAYLKHTPGHTIGSISLIIDNEIAIVGDTMFGIFRRSIFPPFASDQNELLNSWEKLLETKCKIFIPAHGSAISRSLAETELKKRKIIGPERII